MLWWIVGLWLAPAVFAMFAFIFAMLRGKRPSNRNSAEASTAMVTNPLREFSISRYVWGSQEPSPPGIRTHRAVTGQLSIRPMVTPTGCLRDEPVMPCGGCTNLPPELTAFVRALRRRAARLRQRAPRDEAPERSRAFADYLDAQADVLEARQWGSPVVQAQCSLPSLPSCAASAGVRSHDQERS